MPRGLISGGILLPGLQMASSHCFLWTVFYICAERELSHSLTCSYYKDISPIGLRKFHPYDFM